MKLPMQEITEREPWGTSGNEVSEFCDARTRYLASLKEAIRWVENYDNDYQSGIELNKAIHQKDRMNRAYNRANNVAYRIHDLIQEIKALRSGQAISYAIEQHDPVRDDFCRVSALEEKEPRE